ncbi:hydantoinase/oxoprolinase family protein [Mesorhizobium sp. 1B3]|uniref:hydantoinase/oxoprolinase family protein n=1 Tax=Mesorhizobium sp. 1B3 TaxID=3243599 RepID=UPI003D97BA27
MTQVDKAEFALAVDVGGTFVDLTLCDLSTGARWVKKVLSDVGPQKAFVNGVKMICADARIPHSRISRVVHGLTLATNTILEQSNPRAAVVTTEGFADVLEIGRHDAPRDATGHHWLKIRRPITRDRVVEVRERTSWQGEHVVALEEEALVATVNKLRALAPTSVAVCLLNSFINPEHEVQVAAAIREQLPGVHVTSSHDVLPQSGEYERSMAAALNCYTMPVVAEYLSALENELRAIGVVAPLYIMASDGGVLSASSARRLPIHTALSGPAGGAAGAAKFAAELREPGIFTLDVGGTSTDVACAQEGAVDVTVNGYIGDFPLAIPVLDVHTVGAGGGSLARVRDGRFTVGPESAGSRPGPVCYGKGGVEPTVTDALLVMGLLPEELAGGSLKLDRRAAERAIEVYVADPLGIDPISAAAGIIRLANANMAAAIRHISTERGRDPREYALMPFGGAGGLHAVDVAQQIGIPKVVVPPAPGVFTTEGLLAADLSRHFVHSFAAPVRLDGISVETLNDIYAQFEQEGLAWLEGGAKTVDHNQRRYLDLRYSNQGYELIIEVQQGRIDSSAIERVSQDFHSTYEIRYGYSLRDVPIEVVRVRSSAFGILPHAARPNAKARMAGSKTQRMVFFDSAGWMETAVIQREALSPGDVVSGPAIVQEYDSTTVLPPFTTTTVAQNGALIITFVPVISDADAKDLAYA